MARLGSRSAVGHVFYNGARRISKDQNLQDFPVFVKNALSKFLSFKITLELLLLFLIVLVGDSVGIVILKTIYVFL